MDKFLRYGVLGAGMQGAAAAFDLIVHGEAATAEAFAGDVRGLGWSEVVVPKHGDTREIGWRQ